MLLQSVLEALLLIAVVALLWRSKKKPPQVTTAMPEDLKESFERFLSESSRFAESFQKNLEAKKELSSELLLKLDRRLADYQKLLTATEESIGAAEKRLKDLDEEIQRKAQSGANEAMANPAAPEVRAMVLQLAKKGLSLEDIAVRAKLHRGEVELIIDLEQRFKV
jgi:DNA-directed RNA polymerase specialized sigma24 family protein